GRQPFEKLRRRMDFSFSTAKFRLKTRRTGESRAVARMLPAMFRTSDDPQPYWTDRPPRGQAPVPWAGPLPVEPNVTAGELSAGIADRDAICPFLLAADLSWRAATPQRAHRCTAVTPRQPVAP